MKLKSKRIYEEPAEADGFRILVDRLWPRGLSKEKAKVDLWLKEIAPSTELRKSFHHNPEKWEEFREKYLLELQEKDEHLSQLTDYLKKGRVTLLYAAKDRTLNQAQVLLEVLQIREKPKT